MLNQKKQVSDSDALIELFEKIIDVRYKMLKEKEYSNYREYFKLEEQEYEPLLNTFKLYLDNIKK